MKAYSYIRMSRPEQARGDSLRRQLEAAQAWAAERNLDLDDTLRDIGISAYRGKNRDEGALRRFLDLVEAGEIPPGSYLIVESLDRISREEVLEALPRFIDLIRAGVTIVTLSDAQEYSSARLKADWTPLILSLAVMARAHEESRMKGDRVAKAWAQKRLNAAARPLTARCPAWLELIDGEFRVIEDRAAIVRRIFEEAADGIGQRMIATRLNKEGISSWRRGSRGWHSSYIQKLLDGQAVLGIYQPHRKVGGRREPDGDPVHSYFPAVIDEQLYWRARAARSERRIRKLAGRRGQSISNLFTGIARCGECRGPLIFLDKGPQPRGGKYLTCDRAKRGMGCESHHHFRYEWVETNVLRYLGRVEWKRVVDTVDPPNEQARSVEALREQLRSAEEKEREIVEAFEGAPTKAVVRLLKNLEIEIEHLREELQASEAEMKETAHADAALCDRIAAIEGLRSQLISLEGDDLYRLRSRLAQELRRVLRELRVTPRNIVAYYAIPAAARYRFSLPEGSGVPLIPEVDEAPASDERARFPRRYEGGRRRRGT